MGRLIINQDKVGNKDELVKICPFGALEIKDDKLDINSGCKMCKLCVRKGPEGAVVFIEEKSLEWNCCLCRSCRWRNSSCNT